MRRSKGLTSWSWREGMVDVREEHIQLRFGDAAKSVYKQWLPVALVGKPRNQVFPVLWLISPDNPSHEEMIAAARKELDFYLLEKGEPDPWAYAKYHCNTAANVYSDVHWSYFSKGNQENKLPVSSLPTSQTTSKGSTIVDVTKKGRGFIITGVK